MRNDEDDDGFVEWGEVVAMHVRKLYLPMGDWYKEKYGCNLNYHLNIHFYLVGIKRLMIW